MANLSNIQKAFLVELFGPSMGSLKTAAKVVLGTEDYSSILTDDLLAAIRKRGDAEIVAHIPKAIHTLSKMLENPEQSMYMDKLQKIASDILDRAGIVKKEAARNDNLTIGVVLLPAKGKLPEPPTIDQSQKIEGPVLLMAPVIINDIQT